MDEPSEERSGEQGGDKNVDDPSTLPIPDRVRRGGKMGEDEAGDSTRARRSNGETTADARGARIERDARRRAW